MEKLAWHDKHHCLEGREAGRKHRSESLVLLLSEKISHQSSQRATSGYQRYWRTIRMERVHTPIAALSLEKKNNDTEADAVGGKEHTVFSRIGLGS